MTAGLQLTPCQVQEHVLVLRRPIEEQLHDLRTERVETIRETRDLDPFSRAVFVTDYDNKIKALEQSLVKIFGVVTTCAVSFSGVNRTFAVAASSNTQKLIIGEQQVEIIETNSHFGSVLTEAEIGQCIIYKGHKGYVVSTDGSCVLSEDDAQKYYEDTKHIREAKLASKVQELAEREAIQLIKMAEMEAMQVAEKQERMKRIDKIRLKEANEELMQGRASEKKETQGEPLQDRVYRKLAESKRRATAALRKQSEAAEEDAGQRALEEAEAAKRRVLEEAEAARLKAAKDEEVKREVTDRQEMLAKTKANSTSISLEEAKTELRTIAKRPYSERDIALVEYEILLIKCEKMRDRPREAEVKPVEAAIGGVIGGLFGLLLGPIGAIAGAATGAAAMGYDKNGDRGAWDLIIHQLWLELGGPSYRRSV